MSIREREPPGQGKYLPGGDLLHGEEGAPPVMGVEVDDEPSRPQQDASGDPEAGLGDQGWLMRAREAFEFSTSYLDSNYRKKWEDGIRAFNNQHPMDSKYSSPNYSKRSNIFRPKTRSIIRKNEAAASAAFFSNPDAITAEAGNQGDPKQRAAAEVMKQLIQYRLEKSIPWYLTVIGGVQDAQTVGVVCSHQYWEFDAERGVDKPCIDLVAAENLRIDPGADWRDPVESSPYVIELIPMYIGDVQDRMKRTDQKTGQPQWREYGEGMIKAAMESRTDSTRITRNKDRGDPYDPSSQPISDYEIVWIQRHIHRYKGEDWHFYTLGDVALLTDPVPLKEVVHHGKRPYVMGCAIIETHKIIPAGVAELAKPLQTEINDTANVTLDNMYFVLNKRWLVKRGQNTDLPGLVRNVAGNVILTNDPEKDIKEVNWPDVNVGAFQQQDRLTADFADLTGDFSANQAAVQRKGNEPGKIMAIQAQAGTPLTEYLLRTIVTTWLDKVLRQLVLLEAEYETDQNVLAIVGERAKLRQKFGIDRVTDDMLRQEMTIRVNVGMGATDPFQKLQKFLMGVTQFKDIALQAPPGLSLQETAKEIFGLLGYQDGGRFFGDQDPEKLQLKAQLQHAGQIIQELGKRHEDKTKEFASKEKIAHEGNIMGLLTAAMAHDPILSHAVMRQLGPGQGFQVPAMPFIAKEAGGEREKINQAKDKEKLDAQEKDRQTKLTIAGIEKLTKMEMQKNDHAHAEKIAKESAERESKSKKEKDSELMPLVKAIVKGQEETSKAILALAEALTAPKTKETKAVKDARGGFTMTTTEHAAGRQ